MKEYQEFLESDMVFDRFINYRRRVIFRYVGTTKERYAFWFNFADNAIVYNRMRADSFITLDIDMRITPRE